MEKLFYPVTVDILEKHLPPIVHVKQGDTARGVAIALTASGAPYEIPAGGTYMVRVRKPDKTTAVLSAENKSNILYAEFSEQALAIDGQAIAEAAIYAADGKIISSFLFGLDIEKAACTSTKITSSDEYDALAKLLAELHAAEAARAQAESERATAEAARVQAEAARTSTETTRSQNESERQSQEAARVQAEAARAQAEQQRNTNEAQRTAAEAARAQEYASFMATYAEALSLLQSAAKDAEAVKEIYSKMQITLYYDENGGICCEDAAEE